MKSKRLLIKLNSQNKIEALLQEAYDESCRQLNQAQDNIAKLTESTTLSEETIEGKTKFAKSINDFLTQKNNAITKKMEIGKLLIEVLKHKGSTDKIDDESNIQNYDNWGDIMSQMKDEHITQDKSEPEEYKVKKL